MTLTAARPERILLADDNADMREYVRRLLSDRYVVKAVAEGSLALAAARAEQLDPCRHRRDDAGAGRLHSLLRELRQDHQTATIPVIMLSARAGEEARVEGIQSGADDYLVKPFGARELKARVRRTWGGGTARGGKRLPRTSGRP